MLIAESIIGEIWIYEDVKYSIIIDSAERAIA
jgi:hypothetical protein